MNFETKLSNVGFDKLQEKEDFIFFAKSTMQNSEDMEQICIVYDKKRKKIKSMDTFLIRNEVLKVVENKGDLSDYLAKTLSS